MTDVTRRASTAIRSGALSALVLVMVSLGWSACCAQPVAAMPCHHESASHRLTTFDCCHETMAARDLTTPGTVLSRGAAGEVKSAVPEPRPSSAALASLADAAAHAPPASLTPLRI